jgi:uncharacterized protein (TIGR02270 family)
VIVHPRHPARPIGFSPREISSLVNRPVLDQHAADASFLWTQRSHATAAPHYQLKHLAKLDSRLLAHLRGLEIAGPVGWDVTCAALAEIEPGAVFVAAYLAFGGQAPKQMLHALQIGLSDPVFERALLSALSWLPLSVLSPAVDRLNESPVAAYRRIGLATLVAHRGDAERHIERATRDNDSELRALAAKAVGEMGRRDLLLIVQKGLRDPDPICRFWTAWALALHGDGAAAKAAFEAGWPWPRLRRASLEVALRCGEPRWARDIARQLAASTATKREGIQAVGIFGDPVVVPWLIEQLEDTVNTRVAGEALSMITGVDLELLDLAVDALEDAGESNPDDAELPWPNPAAVHGWWKRHVSRFSPGQRHIAGRPVSAEGALSVLREGYQRQRAGAAIELALHSDSGLFAVDARADWQRRTLST